MTCRMLAALAVLGLTTGMVTVGTAEARQGDPPVLQHPPAGQFSTQVDNPWMPMRPGAQWRFVGHTAGGTEHSVTTVLVRTKVVDGVRVVIVHDVTRRGSGRLLENTYDWFAQDSRGRVWYFGENTKAYAGGKVSREGSWQAGRRGARAGIVMEAHPRVTEAYRQEYRKGVAEDQARILSRHASATVPYGALHGLLKTRDFSRLEPGGAEVKYYARGVGVVLENALHEKDRNELVRMTRR